MSHTLVIDDDSALVESLIAAAANAGVDIATATSWTRGIELFLVLGPELVIADYNMPGTDNGLHLLERVRLLRPSVRLILISGFLSEDDMKKSLGLGVVDRLLTKGSAIDTANAILDEARSAATIVDTPTDWVAYADAYLKADSVSTAAVESVDAGLIAKLRTPP
jgi:CheY-like chemotaxis protein